MKGEINPEVKFKPPKYKESLPPSAKWDDGVMYTREGKPNDKFYKVSLPYWSFACANNLPVLLNYSIKHMIKISI